MAKNKAADDVVATSQMPEGFEMCVYMDHPDQDEPAMVDTQSGSVETMEALGWVKR